MKTYPLPLIALLLLTCGQILGSLCVVSPAQTESPYHFAASVIESLSYAKSAIDRTESTEPDPDSPGLKFFFDLKLAQSDLECAKSHLAPYAESSSELISQTAKALVVTFDRLVALHEESIQEYRAVLDEIPQGRLGTVLEKQADLGVSYDETWKSLLVAAIMATHAIVEVDPGTGLMSGLALTPAQQDELLQKLRSAFGKEVTQGMKAGQMSRNAAAAALYQVFSDPRRKLREP